MSNEFELQFKKQGYEYMSTITLGIYTNNHFIWDRGSRDIIEVLYSPLYTYKIFDEYGKEYTLEEFLQYIIKVEGDR